jgi:protein-tyrosine phosphatase
MNKCGLISKIVQYPNGSTIYLSGAEVYDDIDTILVRERQISVVLSFTKGYLPDLNNHQIRHYIFGIDDDPTANIYTLFEKSYLIIMGAIQQERNILIHCRMGVSRSVTILISFFLMCLRCHPELIIPYIKKTQTTWTESILDYIRSRRSCASPNPGFIQQLIVFETQQLPPLSCYRQA